MNQEVVESIYSSGYAIVDNFLSTNHCRELLNIAQKMHDDGQFKRAKIGSTLAARHHDDIRRDKICWLDENNEDNKALQEYLETINHIATSLNRTLFLGLDHLESHFSIYQPGDFYQKHVDQFNHNSDRRISCVYYINSKWHETFGGELKLYDPNDHQLLETVLPLTNRFVCFISNLPHEVCETKKTRYSIAGWLKVSKQFS